MKKYFTKKKILIYVAVLVLLIGGIIGLLHTPWIRSVVKSSLEGAVNENNHAHLEIGSLDFNLLKPRFTIKNIRLGKSPEHNQPPLFQAKAITVQLPYSTLWKENPEIAYLDIQDPKITILLNKDGTSNIPSFHSNEKISSEKESSKTVNSKIPEVVVQLLQISQCSFTFTDLSRDLSINIPSISLKLNHLDKGKHQLQVENNEIGTLTSSDNTLPIDTLQLEADMDTGALNALHPDTNIVKLKKCRIKVSNSSLYAEGALSGLLPGIRFADSQIKGRLNLDDLRKIFPQNANLDRTTVNRKLKGDILISANIKGTLDNLIAGLTVKGENLADEDNNAISINGDISLEENNIFISDFLLIYGDNGGIHGKGELYLRDLVKRNISQSIKQKPNHLNIILDNVNLTLLKSVTSQTISSRASGGIDLSWNNLSLESVNGTARLKISPNQNTSYMKKNLSTSSPLVVLPSGEIPLLTDFEATVSGGNIILDLKELHVPGIEAYGKIKWSGDLSAPISGRLHMKTTALQDILPPSLLQEQLKIDCMVSGTPEVPQVKIKILNQLFDTIVINSHLNTAPPYSLSVISDINSFPAHELLKLAGSENKDFSGKLTGEAKIHLNLAEPMESLNIGMNLSELLLRGKDFEIRNNESVRFSFDGKKITVLNAKLTGNGIALDMRINGEIPLNDGGEKTDGITMEVEADLNLPEKILGEMTTKGKLTLHSTLSGSLIAPKISGNLHLENGMFSMPDLPGAIENMELDVEVDNNIATVAKGNFDFMGNPFNLGKAGSNTRIGWRNNRLSLNDFFISGGGSYLGVNGHLEKSGTGVQQMDFVVEGEVDNSFLNQLTGDLTLTGKNDFRIKVTGPIDAPLLKGKLNIHGNGLEMRSPRLLVTQVNGSVLMDNDGMTVERITGFLNGGTMTIAGGWGRMEQNEITLSFENSLFHYSVDNQMSEKPLVIKSEASGKLAFKSENRGNAYELAGNINLLRTSIEEVGSIVEESGLYLHPVLPETEIFSEKSMLDNLKLNVDLETVSPIWVDSDVSKSEIVMNLGLRGTAALPGLIGRSRVKSGGEVYLYERTFSIDRGIADFNTPDAINPEIDLEAHTEIGGYTITLKVQGTQEKLTTELSSKPALPHLDILSLLMTGRKSNQLRASNKESNGDPISQFTKYLGGLAAGVAAEKIRKFTGVDNVRIDTGMEDKEARLTVSKRILQKLELVLSQSLIDTQKRSYIARYEPFRNINLEGMKTVENEYGLNFNHYFFFNRLKGKLPLTDGADSVSVNLIKRKPVTGDIMIQGEGGSNLEFPVKTIANLMTLKKGKRFDYYRLNRDMEKIKAFYRRNHFLGVSVRPIQQTVDGVGDNVGRIVDKAPNKKKNKNKAKINQKEIVNVVLKILPGPLVTIKYTGDEVPGKIKEEVAHILADGRLGKLALADALLRLRYYFYNRRYFNAEISYSELPSLERRSKGKIIIFDVKRGKDYKKPVITFQGNRAVPDKELHALFRSRRMVSAVFVDKQYVTASLKKIYFDKGFLRTRVDAPMIELVPASGIVRVKFVIHEGKPFKVGELVFSGNRFLSNEVLSIQTGLKKGEPFFPDRYYKAVPLLNEFYRLKGFVAARAVSSVEPGNEPGIVNVHFVIRENHKGIINDIVIKGNDITKKEVILKELTFKKGDSYNIADINTTRKNLYRLGIFDQVAIRSEPLEQNPSGFEQDYRVEIEVKELKRFRFKYGAWVKSTFIKDDPINGGVSAQFSDYNLFGRGSSFNLTIGLGNRERKMIGYLGFPHFYGQKIKSEILASYHRKLDPFLLETVELGLQQKIDLSKRLILSYGYKLSWNREVGGYGDGLSVSDIPYRYRVGSIGAGYRWDSRDDIMNAVSGAYHNYSIRWAHNVFGSQVKYIRFSGHFSYYKQMGIFVYAGAVRLGLIKDYGIDVPYGERFFAGGGTTIRGFVQDSVGPVDGNHEPVGGNALVLVNQELRIRFSKLFGGVVFFDMGNVYPRISDLSLADTRESIGIGLRIYTPYAIFRLDWGFKLDRRPGESPSAVFFSLGQSF